MISDIELLNSIRVAAPCPASWQDMDGDERTRHCQHCKKSVYNLSDMTHREAVALVRQAEGHNVCVRFYQRKDGTVLTDNCPVGLRAMRNALVRRWVTVASLATLLGQSAWRAIGIRPDNSVTQTSINDSGGTTMGSVAPLETTSHKISLGDISVVPVMGARMVVTPKK